MLLAIAVAVTGVYGYLNYDSQTHYENGKLVYWKIVAKGAKPDNATPIDSPDHPLRPTIRIASFQLGRSTRPSWPTAGWPTCWSRLFPQFDLVAVQGVRGKNQAVLVRLIDQVNAASGPDLRLRHLPHPAARRPGALQRLSVRSRQDRRRSRHGSFRRGSAGPVPHQAAGGLVPRPRARARAEAFTFTLINVETDPEHAAAELDLLADVYRGRPQRRPQRGRHHPAGRSGDRRPAPRRAGQAVRRHAAVLGRAHHHPRHAAGRQHLIDRRATVEFTGRIGSGRPDARVRPDHGRGAWRSPSICRSGPSSASTRERGNRGAGSCGQRRIDSHDQSPCSHGYALAAIRRSLAYAAALHAEQRRKVSGEPYLAHLLAVAAMVMEDGGDEDEAIAGTAARRRRGPGRHGDAGGDPPPVRRSTWPRSSGVQRRRRRRRSRPGGSARKSTSPAWPRPVRRCDWWWRPTSCTMPDRCCAIIAAGPSRCGAIFAAAATARCGTIARRGRSAERGRRHAAGRGTRPRGGGNGVAGLGRADE